MGSANKRANQVCGRRKDEIPPSYNKIEIEITFSLSEHLIWYFYVNIKCKIVFKLRHIWNLVQNNKKYDQWSNIARKLAKAGLLLNRDILPRLFTEAVKHVGI